MKKTAVYSSHCKNTHTKDHTSGMKCIVSGKSYKYDRRSQDSSSQKHVQGILC